LGVAAGVAIFFDGCISGTSGVDERESVAAGAAGGGGGGAGTGACTGAGDAGLDTGAGDGE